MDEAECAAQQEKRRATEEDGEKREREDGLLGAATYRLIWACSGDASLCRNKRARRFDGDYQFAL